MGVASIMWGLDGQSFTRARAALGHARDAAGLGLYKYSYESVL